MAKMPETVEIPVELTQGKPLNVSIVSGVAWGVCGGLWLFLITSFVPLIGLAIFLAALVR